MPLPLSGSDIVSQIKSSAIAAADFGLRNNGPKPNNITSAVQYNSSKPTGFKRQYILSLQQKLNNLVFNVDSPSTYFNTINQLLANQPVPTIVTTTLTQGLYNYFYYAGIDDLQVGTPILNLATTNQNGVQVFDIAQIDQIDPGSKHYIYFSDDKPIQIGNTKIEIIQPSNASKKLKVTLQNGNSTQYEFKDEITIDGETFQFLGSGSGGLFIYKGRNYAIVNTTNTITTEINDPKNNNIDGIALDSDENIYLADYGNNRVLKYNSSTGILIKIYESQLFDNPRGIVLDSANNIYVTNYNANTLVKISATNGDITKVLDNIEKPYGICYNDSTYQRFYITCDGSVKVAGPDPNTGIFGILNSFDSFSDSILKGITIDSLGANIYVVLNTNQVVKILTSNGNATPYYTFTADITNKPNGITIDSSNNLYLVVSGKNKIVRITSQNVADDFVNNNNLNNPQGILYNSKLDNFYVSNKSGIDPILIFNNRYAPLLNNGIPKRSDILWICRNNKYTENEFYVLVSFIDTTQAVQLRKISIYSLSITSRGAVYTKICDYDKNFPACITSDESGNIYITSYGFLSTGDLPTIYAYYPSKKFFLNFVEGLSSDAFYGIEYHNGYIYYSNPLQNKVVRINLSNRGNLPLEFPITDKPTLLSLNKSNGHIFVYHESQTKISEIRISDLNLQTNPIQSYLIRSNISAFAKTSNDYSTYFIDSNKIYKVTPNSISSNELRQYENINFKRISNCVLDSNNRLYVVDDNRVIYSLNDKTISSNIKLPKNNIKQGFVPNINYNYGLVTTITTDRNEVYDLTVDKEDNIFYVDRNNIRKVISNGSITIGRQGLTADKLSINSSGNLYLGYITHINKVRNGSYIEEGSVAGRPGATVIRDQFMDKNDFLYYYEAVKNSIFRLNTQNGDLTEYDNFSFKSVPIYDPLSICIDLNGNILIIDKDKPGIIKSIPGQRTESSILPGSSEYVYKDLIVDSYNNVFCTDAINNCIRKIRPNGVNTIIAGSEKGFSNGLGTAAKFDNPTQITIDSKGNLYVIDSGNKEIRKISTSGNRFYVGDSNSNSIIQHITNISNTYNISIGSNAMFDNPKAIVKDSNENIFVLNTGDDKSIYKINSNQNVSSYANNLPSPNGGMAIDTAGNIYITNLDNTISKINSSGLVETFISSQATGFVFLKNPIDLIIDSNNQYMYILNQVGSIAKVVMTSKTITQLFGIGTLPLQFNGLAIDSSNNLYFLNQSDNAIAKVDNGGALINKFISGIVDATDIYHEDNKLYILTTERKYYLIDLSEASPSGILLTINTENYVASTSITTSTSITQPVKIPDGTEYVNFLLIGGGGSGGYGYKSGGGSGAQLKFRIRVGEGINNLNYFKFEIGKGGSLDKDGGNTIVNFFSDKEGTQYSLLRTRGRENSYSPLPLKDVFIAGGGKSGVNGGLGGTLPKLFIGNIVSLNLSDTSPINTIVDMDLGLSATQVVEGLITANDLINIRGSLYGIDGSISDPLFNIFGLGGDLNSNIYTSYIDSSNQINNGTTTNTLNGNFKKISTTSSSKNFDLSLYSPGKGGDFDVSGNDGLVAWFFEGPSQYTEDTLDSLFKVPKSLMNQKFDNKWFTLLFEPESAVISLLDVDSDNTSATFLCKTDGTITLLNGGIGYTTTGTVKIIRSQNNIFKSTDDIQIVVNSVDTDGKILTWSLSSGTVLDSRNYRIYNITIPEGVTKVDCAMIGAGGNSGPYIREPLFMPSNDISFSIELRYRDYTIITHGPVAQFYSVPPAGETTNKEFINSFSFQISRGTYTLTEICNEINRQLDQQRTGLKGSMNTFNLRFTILTKEDYYNSDSRPNAYYGFITDDNLEMQDFTTGEWDFAGANIYTNRKIREYTIELTKITGGDSFLFRENMNNTFGREFNVSNNLPGGSRVSLLYFPSLLRQAPDTTIPDNSQFFGIYNTHNTSKHPTHILPSFDGGDASNGQYQEKTINVQSGDTLEIQIGASSSNNIQYGRNSLTNNNIFSLLRNLNPPYDLINGDDGTNTEIIHKRNSIVQNTITSLGGKGGLSTDTNVFNTSLENIIDKPGLPPGSFTYPTKVPAGWQDGYGKGGTTNRNLSYDNPGVRGSHGCVMIKFS